MVIRRLLPQHISRYWEIIRHAIKETTRGWVEPTEEYMTSMIGKLMSGTVQCWAVQEAENGNIRVAAFLFTAVVDDPLSNQKNLLLNGIYVTNSSLNNLGIWRYGLKVLLDFARNSECRNLMFYTDVPDLVQMAEKLGATTNITFGFFPT